MFKPATFDLLTIESYAPCPTKGFSKYEECACTDRGTRGYQCNLTKLQRYSALKLSITFSKSPYTRWKNSISIKLWIILNDTNKKFDFWNL